MTALRRAAAFVRDHPKVVDPAVAVIVAVLSVTAAMGGECLSCEPGLRGLDALGYALLIGASLSLAWMRRAPLLVFAANLVLIGVYLDLDYTEAYTGYSVFVAVLAVAAHRPLWTGVTVGAVCSAIVFAVALGAYLRTRWALLEAREAQARLVARDAELLRERDLTQERGRIARELHDVVAHAMSVVALQIGGARLTMTRDPARADEALGRAEAATREAMSELRRLLGVLRPEGDEGELSPQPGIDGIAALLDGAREAGLNVSQRTEGEPFPLPATLQLSLFRIVQESITNALRHAGPGADLTVLLRYGDGRVEAEVRNGPSALRAPSAAAGGAGSGRGLIGMRERAAMFGGTVTAGPQPDGGYRVVADLPLPQGEGSASS